MPLSKTKPPISESGSVLTPSTSSEQAVLTFVAEPELPAKFDQAKSSKQTRILFFGDIMLDRGVRQITKRHGVDYLLENLKGYNFFAGHDYVGANLEGAITDGGAHLSPVYKNDFAFAPADVSSLKQYNFNIFNLANNHLADQGEAGEVSTRKYLAKFQFNYFGCHDRQVADCTAYITASGSTSVAWLGFSQVYGRLDINKVKDKISAVRKQADFVVVNAHWGNEYQEQFNAKQQALAHAMIEAGADVVIGHHPHVVQGLEVYQGHPIFYSLGNLIFDQYFSAKTQEGLGIGLNISDKKIEAYLFPLALAKSQPKLLVGNGKRQVLAEVAAVSAGNEIFKEQIKSGHIVISVEDK